MSTEPKITERGWAAYFSTSQRCRFRRNTLIEYTNKKIIVSTLGNSHFNDHVEEISENIFYETRVFWADWDDPYWEIDVTKEINNIESPRYISEFTRDSDWEANKMHETVVSEVAEKLKKGEI